MDFSRFPLTQETVSNNGDFIATGVFPAMAYENGQRTDRQVGIKVRVVIPNLGYEQLTVTVASTLDPVSEALKRADADHPVRVTFDGFVGRFYVLQGKGGISAKADAVRVVAPPTTAEDGDFDFGN